MPNQGVHPRLKTLSRPANHCGYCTYVTCHNCCHRHDPSARDCRFYTLFVESCQSSVSESEAHVINSGTGGRYWVTFPVAAFRSFLRECGGGCVWLKAIFHRSLGHHPDVNTQVLNPAGYSRLAGGCCVAAHPRKVPTSHQRPWKGRRTTCDPCRGQSFLFASCPVVVAALDHRLMAKIPPG